MADEEKGQSKRIEVSNGGAAASDEGIAAGMGGVAARTIHGSVYMGGKEEETPIPRQIPEEFGYYAERQEYESNLRKALLGSNNEKPLVLIYGLPGMGKTTLATHVVRSLKETDFPDGILWGDLANRNPSEQLRYFLGYLDRKWLYNPLPKESTPKDVFWQELNEKKALIVLDNVNDAQSLKEILSHNIGNCRVLAISIPQLSGLSMDGYQLQVGAFKTEDEALALFRMILGKEQVAANKQTLRELCRELENYPHVIATTAIRIKRDSLSPEAYLRQLQKVEERHQLWGFAAVDGLEFSIQNLSQTETRIFELTGILGEGDWHYKMLAAAALQPPLNVKEMLDDFVNRGLVESVGDNRYRVNTLIRNFVQERLRRWDKFALHASCNLLARYCLDIAQDHLTALQNQSDLQENMPSLNQTVNQKLVKNFRNGLLPEICHFRQVLNWATENRAWEIIRRFSYLPFLSLIEQMVVDGGYQLLVAPLTMVTILHPSIQSWNKESSHAFFKSFGVARAKICERTRRQSWVDSGLTTDNIKIGLGLNERLAERAELGLNISAGQIVLGALSFVDLVDVRWTGVRASSIIFDQVDLVGGQILASDLSYSVWKDCDARQVKLFGSNLSQSVLKNVSLRGADLRDVDLSKSVLVDVDMRGADLRGANLKHTRVHNLDIAGASLENADVDWVEREDSLLDAEGSFISYALPEDVDQLTKKFLLGLATHSKKDVSSSLFSEGVSHYLYEADLRGADLSSFDLSQAHLGSADLRAAKLSRAYLAGAVLNGANLVGADMTDANLARANLNQVNLRSAELTGANLQNASMENAEMQSTHLVGANLSRAILHQASLIHAHLGNAVLENADLTKSNLSGANLTKAKLEGANLSGAILVETNFHRAKVTDEQLGMAEQIQGIVLPSGQRPSFLSGNFANQLFSDSVFLRFAQITGNFYRSDFAACDLLAAHMSGNFEEATFAGANMTLARIRDSNFAKVDFTGADLTKARLGGNFEEATFSRANVTLARIRDSNFAKVDFTGADLTKARLEGNFAEVYFTGADLTDARLEGNFAEVDFTGADLADARLEGNFEEADFSRVDLSGAVLIGNFIKTNFAGANLESLKKATIDPVRLRGATMPGGSQYDGSMNLAGDLADAQAEGINIDDPEAMGIFYRDYDSSYESIEIELSLGWLQLKNAYLVFASKSKLDQDEVANLGGLITEMGAEIRRGQEARLPELQDIIGKLSDFGDLFEVIEPPLQKVLSENNIELEM